MQPTQHAEVTKKQKKRVLPENNPNIPSPPIRPGILLHITYMGNAGIGIIVTCKNIAIHNATQNKTPCFPFKIPSLNREDTPGIENINSIPKSKITQNVMVRINLLIWFKFF